MYQIGTQVRTFRLEAPVARVLPLFTALGERAWAQGWEPELLGGREERGSWREASSQALGVPKSGRQLIARSKELAWPRVEAAVAEACAGASGPLLAQLSALEEALAATPLHVRAARTPARGRRYA
jgi:hypothetical protein